MPRLRPVKDAPEKAEVLEADPAPFENQEESALFEAQEPEQEEVVEKPVVKEKDDTLSLKQQIEALQRSEKLAKEMAEQANRDREEAVRRAQEQERERLASVQAATESRLDAVNAAIAAANAEAEKAQSDYESASSIGDVKGMSEAQRRMARAEASIARLEDGKVALEEAKKNPPQPQRSEERRVGKECRIGSIYRWPSNNYKK